MPYIKQKDRAELEKGRNPRMEGELNYAITMLIHKWLSIVGVSYFNLNAAIGVLECAKLECYRRIAAPYEDSKIKANGDLEVL